MSETGIWSPQELEAPSRDDRINTSLTYGFIFDMCGIEIDPVTYAVRVDRYVSMHDAGRIMNPTIAEGQIRGAFAQGIAAALYEEFTYNEEGAFLSGTFADYLVPTVSEIPEVEILHMESPSPFTPLGAKGLAEGNCMSTPACIANAIADALGVPEVILPATPRRIHAHAAKWHCDERASALNEAAAASITCGPITVEGGQVLALLAEYGDDARILAGGQSLVPMLNLRLIDPAVLIDISRIAALDAIRDRGNIIEIGAAVTQNTLMAWPELKQKLPLLAAALPFVGHFQTRNRGTVCGSIAHADPSSEIPLTLAVCGGAVVLRSQKHGERVLAAEAFQQDMLTTARAPDELIAAVRFPVIEGKGVAFDEVARRHGDFAIVAVAAIADARGSVTLGVGGMAGRPMVRAIDCDAATAISAWADALEGYEDLHASAALRRDLLRNLGPRVVAEAIRCAA